MATKNGPMGKPGLYGCELPPEMIDFGGIPKPCALEPCSDCGASNVSWEEFSENVPSLYFKGNGLTACGTVGCDSELCPNCVQVQWDKVQDKGAFVKGDVHEHEYKKMDVAYSMSYTFFLKNGHLECQKCRSISSTK
jgi:hypothetical protein